LATSKSPTTVISPAVASPRSREAPPAPTISPPVVVISPVDDTWNESPVPLVSVPDISRLPVMVVLSERLINPLPLSITTFPVVEPPRVSVWLLVVPRLPRPVRKVLLSPEFADI